MRSDKCLPKGELFCAIGSHDNAKVAGLIANGADVNAPGPIGGYQPVMEGSKPFEADIPLCLASRAGNMEAVVLLLRNNANVNAPCFGSTPLGEAAQYGQEAILYYLLEHGADPNGTDRTDDEAWSPLMKAVDGPDGTWQEGPNERPKQRRMVKRLLAAGADPTYEVSGGVQAGQTALYRADVEYLHDVVVAGILRRAMKHWRTNHPTR